MYISRCVCGCECVHAYVCVHVCVRVCVFWLSSRLLDAFMVLNYFNEFSLFQHWSLHPPGQWVQNRRPLFPPVLVRFSIAVMKHHEQRASWGGKGLLSLHFHTAGHHQRKSGQELKQDRTLEVRSGEGDMEGCCLLACSPWLSQPASYRTQDHQSRGQHHLQWVEPSPLDH